MPRVHHIAKSWKSKAEVLTSAQAGILTRRQQPRAITCQPSDKFLRTLHTPWLTVCSSRAGGMPSMIGHKPTARRSTPSKIFHNAPRCHCKQHQDVSAILTLNPPWLSVCGSTSGVMTSTPTSSIRSIHNPGPSERTSGSPHTLSLSTHTLCLHTL